MVTELVEVLKLALRVLVEVLNPLIYDKPMPHAQCPMPHAQYPMPHAQSPKPKAPSPKPNPQSPMLLCN
jgi:hypothetical protein